MGYFFGRVGVVNFILNDICDNEFFKLNVKKFLILKEKEKLNIWLKVFNNFSLDELGISRILLYIIWSEVYRTMFYINIDYMYLLFYGLFFISLN